MGLALVVAIIVTVLGAVAAAVQRAGRPQQLPRIPVNEADLSTAGIITAVALGQASLAGAVQRGIAVMGVHCNVDRTGLGD